MCTLLFMVLRPFVFFVRHVTTQAHILQSLVTITVLSTTRKLDPETGINIKKYVYRYFNEMADDIIW